MKTVINSIGFNSGGLVRKVQRNGRSHIVAPGVLLTEGVHTGSLGPILYLSEELKKNPIEWNVAPMVFNHPIGPDNNPITVNSEGVLDKSGLGFLDNSYWDADSCKLRTEHYFDEEKTKAVEPRILMALNIGNPFEISTGLEMEIEEKTGTFNGKPYIGIARNMKPDHLAILLDVKGACDIASGCGCLVANSTSFDRINRLLSNALEVKFGYRYYLRDVYPDFFVYSDGNGELFKQFYSVDNNGKIAIKETDPVPVKWVTEYRTMEGAFVGNCKCSKLNDKEISVDKQTMITSLINNTDSAWEESDRPTLEAFSEEKLKKLLPVSATVVNKATILTPVQTPVKKLTVNEHLAELPPEIRELVSEGLQTRDNTRATLIANIKSSPKNMFDDAFLATLPTDQLRGMSELAAGSNNQPNYVGAGTTPILRQANNQNAVNITPLVAPSVIMNDTK